MTTKLEELQALLENSDRIGVQKALKDHQDLPPLKLHILRTSTLEGTQPFLELAFVLLDRNLQVTFGDLGDLNPQNSFEGQDAILVFWRPEDLFPIQYLRYGQSAQVEGKDPLGPFLENFEQSLSHLSSHQNSPIFIVDSTPLHLNEPGCHDPSPASPNLLTHALNMRLYEVIAAHPHLHLVPHQAWVSSLGSANTRDLRMDLYGRIPFAPSSMGSWALMVSQSLIQLTKPRRKVLAIDADNTLWGGVLGEEGWAKVTCGHDYPGNVYLRIQERILGLKESGVLLVLLSKNDRNSIKEVFDKRSDLRIQLEDFIEVHCNYDGKYLNLQKAASSLGLGTNSFALLDDSDVEREEMSTFLPEVLILNRSSEPIEMLESLGHPELRGQGLSSNTHLQYRQRQKRIHAEQEAPSRADFLQSLQIKFSIQPLDDALLGRAHQLCQKTNQFNLTTRRHGEAQLAQWMNDKNVLIQLLKAEDRFGDQGWVALAIAIKSENENQWVLDTFLMSCRVLGKELEVALMTEMIGQLKKLGATSLIAQYLVTDKNEPCSEFLPSQGFVPDGENGEFILHLSSEALPCPPHLKKV